MIEYGGCNEEYINKILRDLLSGPNSTFNFFIERIKFEWDKRTDIKAGYIVQNETKKYNIMVSDKE